MFRLEKLGVLPILFLDLKYDFPLCVSLIFGTPRRKKWKIKWKKSLSIHKDIGDKMGATVSEDQLHSD